MAPGQAFRRAVTLRGPTPVKESSNGGGGSSTSLNGGAGNNSFTPGPSAPQNTPPGSNAQGPPGAQNQGRAPGRSNNRPSDAGSSGGGQSSGAGSVSPFDIGGPQTGNGNNGNSSSVADASLANFGKIPLAFEQNVGQAGNSSVVALSHGPGMMVWLTNSGITFGLPHTDDSGAVTGQDVFTMQLQGANAASAQQLQMSGELPSKSNYLIGNDSSQWLTNVAQYSSVSLNNVYQGVNLTLGSTSADSRAFEFNFVVQPGGSASNIQLQMQGLTSLSTNDQGQLLLGTSGGTVVMGSPTIFQTINGQRAPVAGQFVLGENDTIRLQITGSYDTSKPLVIDPALVYSSYLGGSGTDQANAVAVSPTGNVYLTGSTSSTNFPTSNGFQSSLAGDEDVFVTELNSTGTNAVFSTYLGGTTEPGFGSFPAQQSGNGIALALNGDPVVVGGTNAGNFPTTAGAYQTSNSANGDVAFATVLTAKGDAVAASTFLGQAGSIEADGVALDQNGNVYLTGNVQYSGLGTSPLPTTAGGFQTTYGGGGTDRFVAKFNSDLTTVVYADYLGGSGTDGDLAGYASVNPGAIAVNSQGDAYLTGFTESSNFPVTTGVYQTTLGSVVNETDAFVTEVNAAGTAILASTFVGTATETYGQGIALDDSGDVFITGETNSTTFPTTAGAVQTTNAGGFDAFALELNPSLTAVTMATYLGEIGNDSGNGIAVNSGGDVVVVGSTAGSGFPTTSNAAQGSYGGGISDAFVTELTPTGTLAYSSDLGGSGGDVANGVALDAYGNAFVAGYTSSTNLPGTGGDFQSSNGGGNDAFVSKVIFNAPSAPAITSINSGTALESNDWVTNSQNIKISGTAPVGTTVTLERADIGVLSTTITVSASGTWTYDYTGTTLAQGTYDFFARDTDSTGTKSAFSSPDFLVNVELTGPTVTLLLDSSIDSVQPSFLVSATDPFGIATGAPIAFEIGTAVYSAVGTYSLEGPTLIQMPIVMSPGTTYTLSASLEDNAGNTGISTTLTLNPPPVSSGWSASTTVLTADPLVGDWLPQLGAVSVGHPLILDQSGSPDQAGDPALVYNSSQVSQEPIVQVTLPTPNTTTMVGSVAAQLTFNGVTAPTVTYVTGGDAPGDTLTLALQADTTITTTGRYGYSVTVQPFGLSATTVSSYVYVVAADSSALGAGWALNGLQQLVSIPADSYGPAGELMVYGTGGARFFAGTSSFTSPVGDNGTLSLSGGTYTYSTPDGETWTFNSGGYETQWTSPDGQEALLYRYDGSNRLAGMTAIDGAVTTFSYGSGQVLIETVNNRTTTLTLSGGNLTGITDPDGGTETLTYDMSQHLTKDQFGMLENNYAYGPSGTVGTLTWGTSASPSVTKVAPAVTQGLTVQAIGTIYGSTTDPDANNTLEQMDNRARMLQTIAPDGGVTTDAYTNGYVTSQTDPLGYTTTYTLDSDGYVTQEELPDGSMTTYQYQGLDHALTTMIDARGNTTADTYDAEGHLLTQKDPLGNVTSYAYYSNGLLESVTDPLNHTTTYAYDSDLRLSTVTDPLGRVTSYSYDANGNPLTTTDALGRVTTTIYNVMGEEVNTINPLGGVITTVYDVSGLQLSTTDELGMTTTVSYDGYDRGQPGETIIGVGTPLQSDVETFYDADGQVLGGDSAAGIVTINSLNNMGEVTVTYDALGDVTQYYYDLDGNLLETVDPMGRETQYVYNKVGEQTQVITSAGTTNYAYDKNGNLTSVTNPVGATTTYTYNADNEQTVVHDPLGHLTSTTYDGDGNVLTVVDPRGYTTSYAYDADNEQITETDAVGTSVQRTTSTSYNAVGDVVTTTDALGKVTSYAYNALDEQITVTDPLGHVTSTSYDAVGDVLTTTDALGKVTTAVYDVLHRQIATIDALGDRTTMVLNADGTEVASLDGDDHLSLNLFDPAGQNIGSEDGLGNVTRLVLDADGETRAVIDSDGNETDYLFDGVGNVTETITPTGTTNNVYDAEGRLTQTTDADGRKITYSYDNDDELTGEVWKNSAGATVNVVTYTYDNDGNTLTAADYNGTVTYTYDAQDRVQSYTNVFGEVLTYTYDGNGNVTQRTDSLGGTLTYVYDNAGRLTSEQFAGTGLTGTAVRVDFGYDNRNDQTTITWFSNLAGTTEVAQSVYNFDNADRLTSIVNKNASSTVLSAYTYTYDTGNLVTSQQHWSEVGTTVYSGTNSYTYDLDNELLSDGTTTYSYDFNGNRTMAGYATGSNNEMTNDGTYTYTYDNEGNLIEKSNGTGQAWYYSYDNLNHLVGVQETSGSSTITWSTFTYDVLGNMVAEQDWTSGGGTTTMHFAYDLDGNVSAQLDGSNNLQVRYLYQAGTNQILARTVASGANAGMSVFLTDNQMSVRGIVNASGQMEDNLDYSGYGVVTESNPSAGGPFEYDGLLTDLGMDFTPNRVYQPPTGTWMQLDPIGFAGGQANLYDYVSNDPTNTVDPSGLLDARLALPLAVGELRVHRTTFRAAVFGPKNGIATALTTLYTNTPNTMKQLQAIASKFTSDGRETPAGVQPNGRVAFVWFNVDTMVYQQYTAASKATFNTKSDRLELAFAVLDSKSIRAPTPEKGITGTKPTGLLPALSKGGIYQQGHGIAGSFGGSGNRGEGNFAPEPARANTARSAVEAEIVNFIKANPMAKVVVLVVYTYPDKKSRIPNGYRFYATDDKGKLATIFTADFTNPKDITTRFQDLTK